MSRKAESVVPFGDEEALETQINEAYFLLISSTYEQRRQRCDEFMALIRRRSPETVSRMEAERMARVGLR